MKGLSLLRISFGNYYNLSGGCWIAESAWLLFRRQTLDIVDVSSACVQLDNLCVLQMSKPTHPGCEMPLMDLIQATFCMFAIVHSALITFLLNCFVFCLKLFKIASQIISIVRSGQCSIVHVCQNKRGIGSSTLDVLSHSLKHFSVLNAL